MNSEQIKKAAWRHRDPDADALDWKDYPNSGVLLDAEPRANWTKRINYTCTVIVAAAVFAFLVEVLR